MAASINDYFNLVNNGALAEPAQLAAPKQTNDTTASLTLATGWPTATAVHLALFKTNTDGTVDNATVTYWKATLAGTTLSDMTLKGGTNQAYATGDSAVILSPYQFNDMVEGILKEHNQDGTHKDITTDNLTVSSNVTLPPGSITPNNLQGGAGTDWAWKSWTPTVEGYTGTPSIECRYTQIGKTVHIKGFINGTSNLSQKFISLPVPANTTIDPVFLGMAYTSGANGDRIGAIMLRPGDGKIQFYCGFNQSAGSTLFTGWANSGDAGFRFTATYEAA